MTRRPRERRRKGAGPRSEIQLLAGIRSVGEALRARRRRLGRLLLRAGRGGPAIEALLADARVRGVSVQRIAAELFDRAVPPGVQTQGVLLEAGPLPEMRLEDLAGARCPEGEARWLVAVDGVEDPQNLGAIMRVGEAAGVRGVLLPERRAAPLSSAVSRASAGAAEFLPVARVKNLSRALNQLKSWGFWVLGADSREGQDLFEVSPRLLAGDLVLVLGAEGRGLRRGVLENVDALLRIPMSGRVASLNVATAAAVVLFEWRRRARLREPG